MKLLAAAIAGEQPWALQFDFDILAIATRITGTETSNAHYIATSKDSVMIMVVGTITITSSVSKCRTSAAGSPATQGGKASASGTNIRHDSTELAGGSNEVTALSKQQTSESS